MAWVVRRVYGHWFLHFDDVGQKQAINVYANYENEKYHQRGFMECLRVSGNRDQDNEIIYSRYCIVKK